VAEECIDTMSLNRQKRRTKESTLLPSDHWYWKTVGVASVFIECQDRTLYVYGGMLFTMLHAVA